MDDTDFLRLIAILRLAVPYTGMILTAREPVAVRKEAMRYGVSQIDGGTKPGTRAVTSRSKNALQNLNREHFEINDPRSLNEIIDELHGRWATMPLCTGCYRVGRTGQHFMQFSVPGFIKRYCRSNATPYSFRNISCIMPLEEHGTKRLERYRNNLSRMEDKKVENEVRRRLERIRNGERDLFF
ncbi:MAG: hypothetical protein U5N26_03740 [Candidatus Marinimicrobia bacterium]|nr:hypothetical protein [Candidatus Neomarinimicrobiota bacterium]